MSEYVIDASALVLAVGSKDGTAADLRQRLVEARTHAPHLVDAEVGNVLRRHEMRGLLATGEALAALRAARAVIGTRYPHQGSLGEAAWGLRHDLSFYDALYVALAGALEVPLLTADVRLSRAARLPCTVELV